MDAYRLRGIFSKNLKDVLSKNGITQAELAEMMGVSYSSVSAWCTGVKMPRMDKIEWIANRFGIQKSDLIEEPNEFLNVRIAAHEISRSSAHERIYHAAARNSREVRHGARRLDDKLHPAKRLSAHIQQRASIG